MYYKCFLVHFPINTRNSTTIFLLTNKLKLHPAHQDEKVMNNFHLKVNIYKKKALFPQKNSIKFNNDEKKDNTYYRLY